MKKSDEAQFSKKKWGPNFGPKGAKMGLKSIIYFFVFVEKKSLEFASIVYGNRERWYLAGRSGQSAEKQAG